MDIPLLELKGIRRSYSQGDGETEILHGIDLTVMRGEMVAVIGPSGSGKSTLMNIMGCLDTPTQGSYKVCGRDTSNLEPDELAGLRRDFFGFIFQRYLLLGHLDALENVQVPAIYAGIKQEERESRALWLLERLGLKSRAGNKPSQLSGGQQQRVSIARALMNGGQIILADEPTGALDTQSGVEVMKILNDLNAQGHTVILVTHDPRIAAHAPRVITIEDGVIKSDEKNPAAAPREPLSEEQPPRLKKHWFNAVRAYYDRFRSSSVMALRALVANRMRTVLTMLGIIIGIMAVVTVVALARGASNEVMSNIASMGTNTLTVMPGKSMADARSGKIRTLTIKDVKALKGQPFVDSATAVASNVVYSRIGSTEFKSYSVGVSTDYFRVFGMEIARGRFFSEDEAQQAAQVCVLDAQLNRFLFQNRNAVGKHILIGKVPFKVIGVLKEKEVAFRSSDNMYMYVPYLAHTTRLIKRTHLTSLIVRIADGFSTAVAERSLTELLKVRHGRKDFFVQSSDTILKSLTKSQATFTLLISAIALISLVVGGIGVMNIMLVSVSERTREIGIRMAVGARQADILSQFLIESVTVCLIGGMAGVLLSVGLGWLLSYAAPDIPMSFSPLSVIIAVATSSIIGVVFGYIPARNASRLNPIEALARE